MRLGSAALMTTSLALTAVGAAHHSALAAPACDRQIVMQIDSAKISVEPGGISVDAFGVAESAGWSNPKLLISGTPSNGVANVDFVACRPEVSAQVLTPIQAHETLDLDPSTRQIVIRAKTNKMTVEISH
jgi:hypothetical protein